MSRTGTAAIILALPLLLSLPLPPLLLPSLSLLTLPLPAPLGAEELLPPQQGSFRDARGAIFRRIFQRQPGNPKSSGRSGISKSSSGPQIPAINPRCPENRIRRGELRLGLNPSYKPLYLPNGSPDLPGIDVEIARELSCALQVSFAIVAASPDGLLHAISQGRIDLALGGISSSLRRARAVHFSNPYIITTAAGLLTRSSLPPVSQSEDFPRREYRSIADLGRLAPLKIGVIEGTANQMLVEREPQFRIHGSPSVFREPASSIQALLERRIDLFITDGIYIQALILEQPQLLNDLIALTAIYREEHLSMAVPQGDPEFLSYINFFIKELKRTGRLQSIIDSYLKSDLWTSQK